MQKLINQYNLIIIMRECLVRGCYVFKLSIHWVPGHHFKKLLLQNYQTLPKVMIHCMVKRRIAQTLNVLQNGEIVLTIIIAIMGSSCTG